MSEKQQNVSAEQEAEHQKDAMQERTEQIRKMLVDEGYDVLVMTTNGEHCAISMEGDGNSIMRGAITGMLLDKHFHTLMMGALSGYREMVQAQQEADAANKQ